MDGLIDVHSHILPAVDDGSQSIEETVEMLREAKLAGVTSIIATPHKRAQKADVERIRRAYDSIKPEFEQNGIELLLGFECHYGVLQTGAEVGDYLMADTNVLLLEFSCKYFPMQWENEITAIQKKGIEVVIAHPERYEEIQKNIEVAERMAEIGCELQLSADSLGGGIFSKERKCATKLLEAGLVGYIASYAHCAGDYKTFNMVMRKQGDRLERGTLLANAGRGI